MALEDLVFEIKADASKFRRELRGAADEFERFNRETRFARRDALDFAQSAGEVALAVGAIGTALAANALRETANFEQSLARVGAVSQATADEMAVLEDAAREAGATTQFSAQEAADGLGFLAQAGFEVNEQIDALPGTLDLAAAGQLELAEASDIASNVLSGFNLQVAELSRVNDTLAATAARSNTNVQQLGQALSFAAPVASSLSISVEETAAAIGVFSDAGIQASRAGTSLRQILAKLQDASRQLGAGLTPAKIETLGLAGSIRELEKAGLTAQNAVDVFGTRAGPALAALLQRGTDELDSFATGLADAEGAATEMADRLRDTLSGDVKELRSAVGELNLTFGEFNGPVARAAVQTLTGMTRSASENAESFDSLAQSSIRLADDLKGAVDVAAVLLSTLRNLGAVLQTITAGFQLAIAAVTDLILGATELGLQIGTLAADFLGLEERVERGADAIERINELQRQFSDAEVDRSVAEVEQAWSNASKTGEALGRTAEALNERLDEFQRKARLARARTDELGRALDNTAAGAGGILAPASTGADELPSTFAEALAQAEGVKDETGAIGDAATTATSKWQKLADEVRDATVTPAEQLQQEMENLEELLERELITVEQFYLRAAQLDEEFKSESQQRLEEFVSGQFDALTTDAEEYRAELHLLDQALEQGLVTQRQFSEIADNLDPAAGLEGRVSAIGGQLSREFNEIQEEFRAGALSADEYADAIARIQGEATRFESLSAEAREVRDSLRTLGEQAQIDKRRLRELFDEGLITAEQFRAKLAEIDRDLDQQRQQIATDLIGEVEAETKALESIGEQVAQSMSQNFETFFFDVFEGNAEEAAKKLAVELARVAAVESITEGIGALFGGATGFASGGYVTGPGTPTSDSIPARLSDGEYVVNAKAVDAYGKSYLDALNSMRLPRNAQPVGFAQGGQAGGGQNQKIVLVDRRNRLLDEVTSSDGRRTLMGFIGENAEEIKLMMEQS